GKRKGEQKPGKIPRTRPVKFFPGPFVRRSPPVTLCPMDAAGNIERALLAQLRAGFTEESSPLIRRVLRHNQILLHNYRAEAIKDCRCALEGCGEGFAIVLIPNQALYPKYCKAHRSEFRREFHRQQRELALASAAE